MVSERVKKSTIRKKRRFAGNKWTKLNSQVTDTGATTSTTTPALTPGGDNEIQKPDDVPMLTRQKTASQSKIEMIQTDTPSKRDYVTGNRIIDMEILGNVIEGMSCPVCHTNRVKLHEDLSKKKGLASKLVIKCSCSFEKQFYTS